MELPFLGDADFDAAAWNAAVRALDGMGWEPFEPEDGGPWDVLGETLHGAQVVHLYARESITSQPTLEEVAESMAEVLRLAD